MTDYILEIYTLNASTGVYTRIGELSTYFNLNWTKIANKPAKCTFSMNSYSKEGNLIQPFKNWVLIKRNGLAEYFGNIIDVKGFHSSDSGQIDITCGDILYALNNLYTVGSYVKQNIDAGALVTDLITVAQAKSYGNFGLQAGGIETIGTTNETLFYQSIGKAITNQSDNIVGFDVSFVPILDGNGELSYIQYNVYKALGTVRNNLPPLELGYSVNLISFGMLNEVKNKIYTLGSGTGFDVSVATSTGTTQSAGYSLREAVNKEGSVSILQTLQDKGDTFLSDNQGVKLELGFQLTEGQRPYYGDFGLFDTLPVKIEIGNTFFNFNGTAQIRELAFTYDNNTNKETITPIIQYNKV